MKDISDDTTKDPNETAKDPTRSDPARSDATRPDPARSDPMKGSARPVTGEAAPAPEAPTSSPTGVPTGRKTEPGDDARARRTDPAPTATATGTTSSREDTDALDRTTGDRATADRTTGDPTSRDAAARAIDGRDTASREAKETGTGTSTGTAPGTGTGTGTGTETGPATNGRAAAVHEVRPLPEKDTPSAHDTSKSHDTSRDHETSKADDTSKAHDTSKGHDSRLIPQDESDKFELRLRHAVGGFVDGPRDAVQEADQVLEELAARFADAVSRRRKTLRTSWQGKTGEEKATAGTTDTEQLRIALKDYREVAERLLKF
ncbi:hypothetical protein ACIP79_15230 [Streptomyces sp. NPDC088747]|uniref:hypothetical protein n=1 Tax=Streptomyces sp. NPDC088747 TaxID=3365886 RepID=UPI00380E9DE9